MAISGGDGSIILTTQVDQTGLKRGMASMKSGVAGLSKSFTKIGAAIGVAFGVSALVNFGKAAVNLASDLQEVQNVVDVAFGDMSYKAEEFAKSAIENFGISELSAKRTASTYMAMAKGMGIAEDVASDMAITMTGLTADIASFYNMSQERADVILKSVYTGETETLKQLGIVMTEVNLENFAMSKGITKSLSAMTQQEKTMLRYQFVLEQTRLAQGDFVRTQDSWANQTRILSERWKEMQTVFGEAFMTVGTLVLPTINSMIKGLTEVAKGAKIVAQWIYKAFTGKDLTAISQTQNTIQETTSGVEGLGNAVEEAGEKASKSLAGFDDLSVLTSKISNDSADAGFMFNQIGGGLPYEESGGFEEEKGFTFLQKWLEEYDKIDYSGISGGLSDLGEAFGKMAKISWTSLEKHFEKVLFPLQKFTIEETTPRLLETLTDVLNVLNTVLEKTDELIMPLWENFLMPIVLYAGDKLNEVFDKLNDALKKMDDRLSSSTAWEDIGTILETIYPIIEPIVKGLIDFVTWVGKLVVDVAWETFSLLLSDIESGLGMIVDIINGDYEDAWEKFKNFMLDNKVEFAKNAIDDLKKSFEELTAELESVDWEGVSYNFGEGLANAILEFEEFRKTWIEKTVNWWNNDVVPFFSWEKWAKIGEDAINGIKHAFTFGLQDLINGAIDLLNGFIDGWNSVASSSGLLPVIKKIEHVSWFKSVGGGAISGISAPIVATGAKLPMNTYGQTSSSGDNILNQVLDAVNSVVSSAVTQKTANTEIVLEIDGREFGRAVVEQGNRENRRIGTRLAVV